MFLLCEGIKAIGAECNGLVSRITTSDNLNSEVINIAERIASFSSQVIVLLYLNHIHF